MNYLFTSESVSEGHPDKVADQISDAVLDEFLRRDPDSKVACETFCTSGLVVVGGEVSSNAWVDIQETVRGVIRRIGYTKSEYCFDAASCGIINTIHEQSSDIHRGVVRSQPEDQGAGDQGMMFGYACCDTQEYMPLALSLSHKLLLTLADIRHNEPELMPYLRPDAKSQFTIEFSGKHQPQRVHTIVLSTQHDDFADDDTMHARIEKDVREIVLPRLIASLPAQTAALFKNDFILHVNPTGKFVIGGPAGDTGLTGRKIIVDTYGGRGAHGGGAFSGKDPSKVDRSAAYAARYIAKNLVAAGVADEILVQLAYAIGVAEPVSIFVDTYGSAHVSAPAGDNVSAGSNVSTGSNVSAGTEGSTPAGGNVSAGTEGSTPAGGNVSASSNVSAGTEGSTPAGGNVSASSNVSAGTEGSNISELKGEKTDAYIASVIGKIFDLRPAAIISKLGLKNPIYGPTAAYGHMGREPYTENGIEFFTWEKLDAVDAVKKAFNL